VTGVVAFLLGAVLLSGCGSDAVQVDSFAVSAAGHDSCATFLAALPDHVADQPKRRVTGSHYAAAWGDPAIVLRCGVGKPKGTTFALCQTANGVDWFVKDIEKVSEDQSRDVDMTTLYRSPGVSVHIPAVDRPPVTVMADLADALKAHTSKTGSCS
jgi:hypothetical protein